MIIQKRLLTLDEYIKENVMDSGCCSTNTFGNSSAIKDTISPGEFYVNVENGYDTAGNPQWELADPLFKEMTVIEIVENKKLMDKIIAACSMNNIACDDISAENIANILKELKEKTNNCGLTFTVLTKDEFDTAKQTLAENASFVSLPDVGDIIVPIKNIIVYDANQDTFEIKEFELKKNEKYHVYNFFSGRGFQLAYKEGKEIKYVMIQKHEIERILNKKLVNLLAESVLEYEIWVDDNGYGWDDEGNKAFVGTEHAGEVLNKWPNTRYKYEPKSVVKTLSAGEIYKYFDKPVVQSIKDNKGKHIFVKDRYDHGWSVSYDENSKTYKAIKS